MTPKWPWALRGHMYPMYALIPFGSKFQSLSLYRPHWDKCTEWPPQMTLNTKRSKVHHTCSTTTPSPNLQSVSLYGRSCSVPSCNLFHSMVDRVRDTTSFSGSLYGAMVNLKFSRNNRYEIRKLKITKKENFKKTTEKKIQKKFGILVNWKRFEGVAF